MLAPTYDAEEKPLGVTTLYSSGGDLDRVERPSPLLVMRAVSKSFGTTHAVQKVDIVLYPSEVIGLMGGNGAGKSTLMKMVGGLIAADKKDTPGPKGLGVTFLGAALSPWTHDRAESGDTHCRGGASC